jgi:hypothetical protein
MDLIDQKGNEIMFVVAPTVRTIQTQTMPLAERAEGRTTPFVPMVYERVDELPAQWEYHVLSVDTREQALPDAAILNELGTKGWILSGVVAQAESTHVTFYFVRQVA